MWHGLDFPRPFGCSRMCLAMYRTFHDTIYLFGTSESHCKRSNIYVSLASWTRSELYWRCDMDWWHGWLIDNGLQSLTNMDAEFNAHSFSFTAKSIQNCTKNIRETTRPWKVNCVIAMGRNFIKYTNNRNFILAYKIFVPHKDFHIPKHLC